MVRRRFLATLLVLLVLAPPSAAAADPAAIRRVGVLIPSRWDPEAFRRALRDLGYREGVNLVLDIRHADGQPARLPSVAAELVSNGAEVIVALNTPGTRAAMGATRTIPIVMAEVGDPVGSGFVSNLARPGGNVTGVSNLCGELAAKRLSVLKEAVPAARRVALLLNPNDPITLPQLRDAERAAPALGVELRAFPVPAVAQLAPVFDEMLKWKPDAALWLCGQQATMDQRSTGLASRHRLPLMSYRASEARGGGLISYSSEPAESVRQVALYVDKILKGAKPADLPVVQPAKLVLIINVKTARQLGLAIPPSLVLRADEISE